jgi:hypothetical protein
MKPWDRKWKSEQVLDKLCKYWAKQQALEVKNPKIIEMLKKNKKNKKNRTSFKVYQNPDLFLTERLFLDFMGKLGFDLKDCGILHKLKAIFNVCKDETFKEISIKSLRFNYEVTIQVQI